MLEDLRKRQKIVIYFIAFVFIVGMAIMGITDIFFNKSPMLGKIDGEKITYEMFQAELQKNVENYRQQNPLSTGSPLKCCPKFAKPEATTHLSCKNSKEY